MIEAKDATLSEAELSEAVRRRLEAMALQAIEGNPLSPEDTALFEMFERERWPHDRRRAHLLERAREAAARSAGVHGK